MKTKQKIKAKRQLQLFSRSKTLRRTAEKVAVRAVSPKSAALLLMYAVA